MIYRSTFIKKSISTRVLAIAMIFFASFMSQNVPVQAFGEYEDYYSRNNILLYDKSAPSCSAGATKTSASTAGTTSTTEVKVEKTANTDTIFKFLTTTSFSSNNSKPMSDAQAAAVMGNMKAESGLRPEAVEATDRADKGHGLVQWTFGRWNGANGLSPFANSKGKDWTDLTTQLQFLQKELESSEKKIFSDAEWNAAKEPSVAAVRWEVVFERANPDVAHNDVRAGAAVAFYKLYGGTSSGADCAPSSGVVAGSLVKTALYFALDAPADDGKSEKADAKITYQNEKATYNPIGDWSDCGAYIATVVIASGVDKNYPKLGVGNQINYVRAHPELYQVDENPTAEKLKPGDIMYIPAHTTMYTGADKYPSADASWHERVPSVRSSGSAQWMISNGAITARFIGKVAGGGGGGV
ncbi:MAG: phage tail tip lysozyme [Candidatus Saccharimonadales bacterium]